MLIDVAENTLIARAKNGDRQAFGELVNIHRKGVINLVYRMSGDAHLAEDIAQEAFIRAWKHLPRYQERSPIKNWLYRIANNAALDHFRKEKDLQNVDDLQIPANGLGMQARMEVNEQAARVQKAILALPPASRSVLIFREYEDMSYKEIADTLTIPIGTVMSRLNYARTQLRKTLVEEQ